MPRSSVDSGMLPSNLFNGGAVALNTSPFTNYYLQTQARDQARNDAITKFVGDYSNKLTPAGMASDDIDDFMKAKNDWQDFVLKNRRGMANPSADNGATYTEAGKRFNNALSIAERSKDKAKNILQLKSILTDPVKSNLLTDGTIEDIHRASKKVTDPDYAPIDYTHVKYNPKPWDAKQEGQLVNTLSHFKGNESFDKYEPTQDGMMHVPHYKSSFDQNQLMGMRGIATNEYHNNPGFKKMIDAKTDIHSTDYPQLNEAFKQQFGTDIHQPEDMATAYLLSINPNKMSRVGAPTKIPVSPERMSQIVQQRQLNVAAGKQAIKNNAKITKTATPSLSPTEFVDNLYNDAKQNDPFKYHPKEGGEVEYHKADVSDATRHLFAHKEGSKLITPDEIVFSKDGNKVLPVFYNSAPSSTGNRAVNKDFSKPMTRLEFENVIGKNFKKLSGSVTTPTSESKPKTVKQNGFTYTLNPKTGQYE